MNNYYFINKLLWWPTHFRNFHLLRDRHYSVSNRSSSNGHTTNLPCSTFSNVNYDGISNSGIMASSSLLVRTISNNHQHLLSCTTITARFCTNTTTPSNIPVVPSSDQNNISKLPDPIEQQCEQWTQILRAESEAGNAMHNWTGRKLRCQNVLPGLNTTKLFLSTEDLTPEQLRSLRNYFQAGQNLEMRLSLSTQQQLNSLDKANLFGFVVKHFPETILISVKQYFNLQQQQQLQQCSFDIRTIEDPILLEKGLAFLAKREFDWYKLPGYATMLRAFKCQPLPEDTGLDPRDWVGSHGKDLDPSQCAALSAALNLKRPIVAVHGPPGSGKTRILTEYLHILSQQGKRVLVVSSSIAGLYHLLGTFCKKFPSAASSKGKFLCLKHFDKNLASKVIADETMERLIEERSFDELQKKIFKKTQENYELTSTLKSAMEKRPDLREEEDLMREAEEVSEQMREISHRMRDEKMKHELQSTSILFTHISRSTLNLFARNDQTFDVVILDDSAMFSEFGSWMMALPTAPVLRLFGDYNQPGIPLRSSIGRELNYGKSLLQRLDEEFVPEVNFHLRRQYRSNAAIQAWPNRAFYGQRAAEPDESVRNIRLDDLLEEGKSPPPELIMDPLVLVDLGQLEGEWREWMFKAERGGKSWQNWGEAFLTIVHLWHLFENIPQLCPSKIAYLTHQGVQRNLIWKIFSFLFEHHLQKFDQIRMERSVNLQGQQFDVVIENSVIIPPIEAMIDPFYLKRVNFEMCRARRQFIWFANSKWLEEGSEQSRQLLQTFRQYGRIVGPNQLLPLERGQFQVMTKKVKENYQKMRDRKINQP